MLHPLLYLIFRESDDLREIQKNTGRYTVFHNTLISLIQYILSGDENIIYHS